MTQQLCRGLLPSPQLPSLPNLLFSTRGLASLYIGQTAKKNLEECVKILGLRKRKGSRPDITLAYFPTFRKTTVLRSLNPPFPHMSQRLQLLSNLEK